MAKYDTWYSWAMPSHPNETLGFVSQKLCQPTPRNISSATITMSTCVNCGSQFLTVKGKKGSKRSLHAKLDSIERTAKDVLEDEFGLILTPRQKETRFTKEGAPAGRWVKCWSTDLAVLCWLNPLNSKRDFDIVNFPFLDGDVPRSASYGVYISQLIRFARVSSHVDDFNTRNKVLTANFSDKDIDIINFVRRSLNFIGGILT